MNINNIKKAVKLLQEELDALERKSSAKCSLCGGYGSYYPGHWSEGISWCPRCNPKSFAEENRK